MNYHTIGKQVVGPDGKPIGDPHMTHRSARAEACKLAGVVAGKPAPSRKTTTTAKPAAADKE